MKTIYTLFIAFTFALNVNAQTETKTTSNSNSQNITVTIQNIKNDKGSVLLGLHTEDTFMKGPGIKNLTSKIENGQVTVTFTNVEAGTYAIMVMHDENDNKRMDFENGMPLESYGMSNNPMSYGPPQYSDAKFEVKNKDLEFNIIF
ncbi:MAG: DUF2141 domain-containing protein [Flavobacteriaceae bacterium]|nr:DUF2141 domain-containing protein [Flavobacteriaceae bacterium]